MKPVELPIRNRAGEVIAHVKVDEADAEWASRYRWSLDSKGYAKRLEMRKENGEIVWQRTFFMHRELLGLVHGDKRQSDHRNGDKLDNRRPNLRIVTGAQNSQNLPLRGGTSQHRGVVWDKATDRWMAYAQLGGKFHNLGRFDDELAAAATSRAFRAEHMPFSEERVA